MAYGQMDTSAVLDVRPPSATPPVVGQILYFAYGANMRRAAFCQRCPGADWLGVARLEGFRPTIAWHGYASVEPAPASTVWGVLWLLPAAHLAALDAFEEVGASWYVRTTARVICPAGPRAEAMIYRTPDPKSGHPHPAYLEGVLAAARENKLPSAYLAVLDRLAGPGRL
jgi:gamma-glutamylcyclotransferase (GGCT)/AIG2-like uncharacterized protein YtfP